MDKIQSKTKTVSLFFTLALSCDGDRFLSHWKTSGISFAR